MAAGTWTDPGAGTHLIGKWNLVSIRDWEGTAPGSSGRNELVTSLEIAVDT
jgi:hypothetical protein